MTVTDNAAVTLAGLQVSISAEKFGDLGLDGLRKQRMRSIAQNIGELIIECSWLNQLGDGIVRHGISLLQWRSGGSSTPTICRLTDSRRHQLLPIAHPQRVRGMSEKLIVSHYENNYGGAVKRLNLVT